jgi:sugar-specific transcriptional regulator TrmB
MNEQILFESGLTKGEALAYTILVKNSPCTPPKLAELINESRTNTYKLLDSLEEKGLVTRDETQPKLRYWANNPAVLLDTLKQKRIEVEASEKRLISSLPGMVDEYFKYSEQPSVRYFYGIDGVGEVYKDQLKDGNPITFTMPISIRNFFGMKEMHRIRNEFPKKKIPRHVFYPDAPQEFDLSEGTVPVGESDKIMMLERTWINEYDLRAPVEWSVYGDKVSIISVDSELVGMIIESKQIAASLREIFGLLDKHIRNEPNYALMPKHMTETKRPDNL